MASPLFFEEDLPESIRSKYEAVIVAGLRARELQRGVKPMVDDAEGHKFTTIAMMEMLDSRIGFDRGEARPPSDEPMQDPLT
jgi:DNA-directed RNA polymerase omega subunit